MVNLFINSFIVSLDKLGGLTHTIFVLVDDDIVYIYILYIPVAVIEIFIGATYLGSILLSSGCGDRSELKRTIASNSAK